MSSNLKIEYKPIEEVIAYPQNARTHSRPQIRLIAKSMLENGFISPILVDKNDEVICGHGRIMGALEIGLKVIPVIRVDHLTPDQVKAYRLADNKIASEAGWDDDLLRVELEFLTSIDLDFDVDLTGFSTTEVDLLLGNDVVPSSDDDIPPAPDPGKPVSQLGDMWILGSHQVSVGDCRDSDTIDRLMGGAQAQMVFSDPPYNVSISGHVSGLGKNQHPEFQTASGEMSPEEFTRFLIDGMTQLARVSVDGSLQFHCMDWRHVEEILHAGGTVYDRLINVCIWSKTNAGMGSLYRSQYEMVFIFKHGTASHINNVELGKNGRYRTNVWNYPGANSFGPGRDEALAMHPTVKPVQMIADAILDVTHLNNIVLDGFLGSGSTLIAAERTGRVCYGVELDAGYVDVTIQRWESITGKRAILAGSDLNIDQVAAERGIQRGVMV